jgi:hypothetical protein
MATVMSELYGKIRIPTGIVDEASFRRWVASDDVPKHVPIRFENGEVIVDLRPPGKPVSVSCASLPSEVSGNPGSLSASVELRRCARG